MIKALIFDFDGLILDTEVPEFQSWQEIYEAHNTRLPLETWATYIGTTIGAFDPHTHLEGLVGEPLDRESLKARHRQRFDELLAARTVLPGVESYLKAAKDQGLKLAVASSSGHAWVDGHLKRLGLYNYFDAVKCAEDVPRAKPDPALYLAALDALGVSADEAIALEDSPNGVKAARAAGIFCVAVPNALTVQLSLGHASLQLTSLDAMTLDELIRMPQVES